MSASESDPPVDLRAHALRLLARREHTRSELERKLAQPPEAGPAVAKVLDALAARGQLSESRYAEARAHTLARKFGTARIRQDLRARGVPEEEAARAAAGAAGDELARARAIVERRYRAAGAAATPAERAKRMRFLLGRGFSSDVARQALKTA